MHEYEFLEAIDRDPNDAETKAIYADWLADRGDCRAEFLRTQLLLRQFPPDHPHRLAWEGSLSILRNTVPRTWLLVVEPERYHIQPNPPHRPYCDCLRLGADSRFPVPQFHMEPQDTECEAWSKLLQIIDDAAADHRAEFRPLSELTPLERAQIITLPATISKLKDVRHLMLYSSDLVRVPPEIGEMERLEQFTPYTSYRLHWFPYEITRCKCLKDSSISTRALYGNYKYRPPFPRLGIKADASGIYHPGARGRLLDEQVIATRPCSVCRTPFVDKQSQRVWISLRVATDVLPLLVNACSRECVERLSAPPKQYVQHAHRGGKDQEQPAPK